MMMKLAMMVMGSQNERWIRGNGEMMSKYLLSISIKTMMPCYAVEDFGGLIDNAELLLYKLFLGRSWTAFHW